MNPILCSFVLLWIVIFLVPSNLGVRHRRACPPTNSTGTTHRSACHVRIVLSDTPSADGTYPPLATPATQTPSGYHPADLQYAYVGNIHNPKCQLVAIVDAYASPNAASDLAYYRSYFGLPVATFTQIAGNGGSISTVQGDTSWAVEQMLDLSMVSAICPCCPILYVGALSDSTTDLANAVTTAVNQGAKVVSMSWGGDETNNQATQINFNHPGVAFTASTGDSGYGVEYPASSAYVTAVGGTTLGEVNGVITQYAWDGAGSGCSAYTPKPSWQKDTGCSRRTVADVSAVADPNTGVAYYNSYGTGRNGAWGMVGGTSVAAPIIAGLYGLYYSSTSSNWPPAQDAYAFSSHLFDVTSGSNENNCRSYLCEALVGYDGPTGVGTPIACSS